MILVFGILIAFLGAPIEPAKPAPALVQTLNSISGYVSDNSRTPIPNLQVELLNDVDSVIRRTKTDSSGLFLFNRLPEGVFQVRVQTYGTVYVGGQTKRVQLERTRAFEQVDFVLTTKQTTATSSTPGAVFVQEVPEPARKEYERGIALLQKSEQQKEGVQSLRKAIALFPTYFEALEMLGTEYVKQQDFEAAIPMLTKAIEINSRAHHSLSALSVAQYNLKQLPAAVESMKRAITHNQKSASANLWLGMLLRQSDKLDEAETYLKQANKLGDSKLPDVHWQLALLFNELKRYREAADELELFLKLQPDARDTDNIKKLIQRFRKLSSEKS
jgi:tetratricopeptide (TPR) repeat protein